MRQINENDYISFTISSGWNLTVYDFKTAKREFDNIRSGVLYGNKPNGERAILDSK